MQCPRVAFHQLEAQPRLGVLDVPGQQRHPGGRPESDRDPHPRIAQRAAAIGQQRQRDHPDADHRNEAVMAERADRQSHGQQQRSTVIDPPQQARTGVQAHHGSQRHGHVRQGHDAQRAGQRQQHGGAASQPRRGTLAQLAAHHAHHHPRQRRTHQQERQAHAEVVVAGHFHAQPDQPCGQSRQVGIGPPWMLAFLPVECLVHEQRKLGGHHQFEQQHPEPQRNEDAFRSGDPQPFTTHVVLIRHPYSTPLHWIGASAKLRPENRRGRCQYPQRRRTC